MTNEKPNSKSDWINKLEEMDSIPGDVFNNETSWNKLHERLPSKTNSRKAVWYWLSAACLFFALLISLFLSNKKENVLVKNNLRLNKNNSPLVQHRPTINKDTSSVVFSSSVKYKSIVHSIHESDSRNTNLKNEIKVKEIVENKKEGGITRGLINNAVMPLDTAISLVGNISGKKKLKVVHINELGDPISESPNIARYNESHSIQFRFINQEVYTRSSPADTKTGFKIFSTKNLTAN